MVIPETFRQLRGFVRLVNIYQDLWKQRAPHMMPLTKLIKNQKGFLKWTEEEKKVFIKIKIICSEHMLFHYPNLNQSFEVHTDSSNISWEASSHREE